MRFILKLFFAVWRCVQVSSEYKARVVHHAVGSAGQFSTFFLIIKLYPHNLSIAFRQLPPNSARFSYATEGALFISTQLSSDAVSTLRKVWVLI